MSSFRLTKGLTSTEAVELTKIKARLNELSLLHEQGLIKVIDPLGADPAFTVRVATLEKRKRDLESKITDSLQVTSEGI